MKQIKRVEQTAAATATKKMPGVNIEQVNAHSFFYRTTVTVNSITAGSFKLQGSHEDVDASYIDIANTTLAVTATDSFGFSIDSPTYPWVRSVYTMSAGDISISELYILKDND